MIKIINKLRSRKGETLTETLVGVLIVGMGTSILVAGISSAVKLNQNAKELKNKLQFNYVANESLTKLDAKIELKNSDNSDICNIEVKQYQDDKGYIWFEVK